MYKQTIATKKSKNKHQQLLTESSPTSLSSSENRRSCLGLSALNTACTASTTSLSNTTIAESGLPPLFLFFGIE